MARVNHDCCGHNCGKVSRRAALSARGLVLPEVVSRRRASRGGTSGPGILPLAAIAGCAMLFGMLPATALAQAVGDNFVTPSLPLEYDRGQNTGVLDRPRPEYEAAGIRLGGFRLRPRVEASVGFTDNVYQTAPRTADEFAIFAPSARLESTWSRNALSLDAGANLWRYARQVRRDADDWHVGASGRYDIGGTGSIAASAHTEHATEPATSAAYPTAAAQSSQYQVITAHLAPSYSFGRVKLQAAYDFNTISFDRYTTFAGTVVDQGNRDATTQGGTARGEYAITPDTSVFLQGNFDRVYYARPLLPGVANRNSNTWRVLGGVSFDIATKLRGSVGLGYMARNYDDALLYLPVAGFTAEMRADYFLDSLTTVTLTGRRIIEDSPYVNTSGFVSSSVALRVDHELLRNLLLNLQGAYEHDAFNGANQSVDVVRLAVGARYLMSRAIGLGLTVSHDARSASGPLNLATYAETRAVVSVVIQQ